MRNEKCYIANRTLFLALIGTFMKEICKKCHPSWMCNGHMHCLEHPSILCAGNLSETSNFLCTEHAWNVTFVSCVVAHGILIKFYLTPPIQCIGNVDEIPCVLVTGNCALYWIRKCLVEISCSKKCAYHEQ